MRRDVLVEFKNRADFRPFKVVTSAGLGYEIENPDNIALGKSEFCYFFPKSDRFVFIPYNHITTVDALPIKPHQSSKR